MGADLATQSLKAALKCKDSLLMADAYRLLGNIYTYGLKLYDEALQFQLNALPVFEKYDHQGIKLAAMYGSITWVMAVKKHDLSKAHEYANRGVAIARRLNDDQTLSYNYNSKGLICFHENRLDSALNYFYASNQAAERVNDLAVIAYNKTMIGQIWQLKHQYRQAAAVFAEALREGEQLQLAEVIKDAYDGLAMTHQSLKQFDKAFHYQSLYIHLRDSLVNWETSQRVALISSAFEAEKKEAKIALLERENKQVQSEKRASNILFAVAVLTLMTIIGLIVAHNRERSNANQLLKEKNDKIAAQNEALISSREEVASQRDLVEKQNDELRKAIETKDKLFSIIGHDLRGPISSLKGMLGLLKQGGVSDDEFKRFIPDFSRHVNNVHDTLENLLHWSKNQIMGASSDPRKLDAFIIAEKTVELFREQAKSKGIVLTQRIARHTQVYADENQLKVILRNLVSNAIKFTYENGSVDISAYQEGRGWNISVEDTGIGMSDQRLSTLFSNNESSYGTRGEKGTGLGLILTRDMVESNGGTIAVESTLGKGTRFSFFLKSAEPGR